MTGIYPRTDKSELLRIENRRKNGWWKNPKEAKEKMSMTRLLKNGRTEPLKNDYRNDSLYRHWCRKIKYRDDNQCQLKDENCSGYHIVHHILSWNKHPEKRYELLNGITLCQYHHPRKREDEQRLISILRELVGSK